MHMSDLGNKKIMAQNISKTNKNKGLSHYLMRQPQNIICILHKFRYQFSVSVISDDTVDRQTVILLEFSHSRL
jgi:hypothetical protein